MGGVGNLYFGEVVRDWVLEEGIKRVDRLTTSVITLCYPFWQRRSTITVSYGSSKTSSPLDI
jgi:hypothetical protein